MQQIWCQFHKMQLWHQVQELTRRSWWLPIELQPIRPSPVHSTRQVRSWRPNPKGHAPNFRRALFLQRIQGAKVIPSLFTHYDYDLWLAGLSSHLSIYVSAIPLWTHWPPSRPRLRPWSPSSAKATNGVLGKQCGRIERGWRCRLKRTPSFALFSQTCNKTPRRLFLISLKDLVGRYVGREVGYWFTPLYFRTT